MPYELNPHRHVKIWLSKDSSTFLNFLNQLRLIRMRIKNPNATIFFIYDSQLLSTDAIKDLYVYCVQNTIKPIDVKDIFTRCTTLEENNLIKIYQDETSNIHQGGNLASASDVLRWLKPIYTLGIYSDFDVEIDTAELPSKISVSSSLLFNFGSLRKSGIEYARFTNDVISVVDVEAAYDQIKKIQQAIYNTWLTPLVRSIENKPCKDYAGLSAREIRHKLKVLDHSNRIELEILSVTQTTGPDILSRVLFRQYGYRLCSYDMFNKHIAPYSLKHYKLDNHFISNSGALHTGSFMIQFTKLAKRPVFSDMSWLEYGSERIKDVENHMKKSAIKISLCFKKHQELKRKSIPMQLVALKADIEVLNEETDTDTFLNFSYWKTSTHNQNKLSEIYCHFQNDIFEAAKFNAFFKLKYYSKKTIPHFFKTKTKNQVIMEKFFLLSKQACFFSLVDQNGDLALVMRGENEYPYLPSNP